MRGARDLASNFETMRICKPIFLLLADLIARTLLSPVELSIGVVTSLVGAVAFVIIFYRARKAG